MRPCEGLSLYHCPSSYLIATIGYFRDDSKMAVLTFCVFNFQAAFILQNLLVIPMPSKVIKDYTWQVGISGYQSSRYFILVLNFQYICSTSPLWVLFLWI